MSINVVDVQNHPQGVLAIGAPLSGNVVVLKTLDVIFFKPSTEIEVDPPGYIKLEEKGKTHSYQQYRNVHALQMDTFLCRI